MNEQFARTLIVIGILLIIVGIVFYFAPKTMSLPKVPGDILIKKENFVFYFPWVSSLIISVILSLIFYLFFRNK